MNRRAAEDTLFSNAYSRREVAEVCLNCLRPKPNCGESGCAQYKTALKNSVSKCRGEAGGKKARILTAFGVEFTAPKLAAGVGYSTLAVRKRIRKFQDAEELCRSYEINNAEELNSALKRGELYE